MKAKGTTVTLTKEDVAKELIRQRQDYGCASGVFWRLVWDAIRRRYPKREIKERILTDGYSTINLDRESWVRMDQWIAQHFRGLEVDGYSITFSPGYADLQDSLIILKEPKAKARRRDRRLCREPKGLGTCRACKYHKQSGCPYK